MMNKRYNIITLLNTILRINLHSDFLELFLYKEGKQLLGIKYKNVYILVSILSITLIAIGFANGSLDYLGLKMDDPFIKFINIDIPIEKKDKIGNIQYELNKDTALKKEYEFGNILGFNKVYIPFTVEDNEKKQRTYVLTGRTLELSDPLLDKILDKENLIIGKTFSSSLDIGLIVSESFYEELRLPKTQTYAPYSFTYDIENKRDTVVPLPIIAVVKELPGMNSFITTLNFYSQILLSNSNPFHPKYTSDIILHCDCDTTKMKLIKNKLFKLISELDFIQPYDPDFDVVINNDAYEQGFDFIINFYPNLPINKKVKLLNIIKEDEIFKDKLIQLYDFNPTATNKFNKFHVLTVNFNKLDKVRLYRDYLLRNYGLEIDTAKIEALENYNFITNITRIISFLLIGFSILSICLFVSNLLSKHLEKIHMNIGTFKAFGINNITLLKIYLTLIYLYVFVSIIISFIISYCFGFIGGGRGILFLFSSKVEDNQSYFNLFDTWTFIAIGLTLLISFIVLRISAGKILSKSPGDLIYSRL